MMFLTCCFVGFLFGGGGRWWKRWFKGEKEYKGKEGISDSEHGKCMAGWVEGSFFIQIKVQ
jgi:hypothetical protein